MITYRDHVIDSFHDHDIIYINNAINIDFNFILFLFLFVNLS